MKKSSRDSRLEVLVLLYSQFKSGQSDEQAIIQNREYMPKYFLFESEMAKIEANPEKQPFEGEEWEEFKQFLTKFEFVKSPKYKRGGGGEGKSANIPTVEYAKELGLGEDVIPTYVDTMTAIYKLKAEVDAILPQGRRLAISIPKAPKAKQENAE